MGLSVNTQAHTPLKKTLVNALVVSLQKSLTLPPYNMKIAHNGGRRLSRRPRPQIANLYPVIANLSCNYSFNQSPTSSPKQSPGTKNPAKIHDRLNIFIGSEADAMDIDFLREKNITKVLSVQSWEVPKRFPDQVKPYEFIKAADNASQNLGEYFPKICQFLKRNENERVLVHCQAGISRSATACLAFMMKEFNQSLECSFEQLRQQRDVCPNFSFLGQLKVWEKQIAVQ